MEGTTAILDLRILQLNREQNDQSRGLTFRDLTFENFKSMKVSPEDMMIEYADQGAIE